MWVCWESLKAQSLRSLHIWQTMATAENPWPHCCASFHTEMPLFFNHAVEPDFPTLSLLRGCSQLWRNKGIKGSLCHLPIIFLRKFFKSLFPHPSLNIWHEHTLTDCCLWWGISQHPSFSVWQRHTLTDCCLCWGIGQAERLLTGGLLNTDTMHSISQPPTSTASSSPHPHTRRALTQSLKYHKLVL